MNASWLINAYYSLSELALFTLDYFIPWFWLPGSMKLNIPAQNQIIWILVYIVQEINKNQTSV